MLPLHRREDDTGWASADWRLRRGRIVLEGQSPAGLRLPLDSISWHPRGALRGRSAGPADDLRSDGDDAAAAVEDADKNPTTALVARSARGFCTCSCRPPMRSSTLWT